MIIRIKDIAKQLNISESTVSRALAGHSKISDKTKERVFRLAKELKYRPNLVAKSLKINSTKTIGLIIDDIANPFYPEIVKGCEKVLLASGLNIILCNSDYDSEKENKYLNVLLSKKVDGIIMTPAGNKAQIISLLKDANTPLVFIDIKPNEKINVSCVYTDQEYGAYIAVKYLFELGHKKIALINGPKNFSSCYQLESGYKKAFKEFGLPLKDEHMKTFNLKATGACEAVKELLSLSIEAKPTAAIFISDIAAIATYITIREAGLRIPEDFSIIGNDDIPTSSNFSPPLTTLSHPKYEMGKKAAELLLGELKSGNKVQAFTQSKYLPELEIRGSSSVPNITSQSEK